MKLYSDTFTSNEFNTFYRSINHSDLGLCKDSFPASEIFPTAKITLYNHPAPHSHKISLLNKDIVLRWGRNKRSIKDVFTSRVQDLLYQLMSIPVGEIVSFWYTVEEIEEA